MNSPDSAGRFWPAALLIVVASAALHAVLVWFTAPEMLTGELIDTDSYMRLVRVRELAVGGGWFDSVISRNNWPYGDELHWTRPFDVVVLAGTWLMTPFLGFTRALYWTGVAISPLMQVTASMALAWAVIPLLGRRLLPLVMIAVLAQPAFMGYSLPGRADHHIFLLLLVVLQIGTFTRAATQLDDAPVAARWATWTGVLGAIGVWGSIELLLPLAAILAVAGGAWVTSEERWLLINRRLSRALALTTAGALLLERPFSQLGQVEYDRISVVHLTLSATLWVVWWAVDRIYSGLANPSRSMRAALTGGAGAATLSFMLLLFPKFFQGPVAEMDPRLMSWYSTILEVQPMWPSNLWELGRAVAFLGGAAFAVLASIAVIRVTEKSRPAWILWAALAGAYTLLALLHSLRLSSGAELLAIPLVIYWVGPLFERIERWGSPLGRLSLQATVCSALLGAPIVAGGLIMGLDNETDRELLGQGSCDVHALSLWMGSDEGSRSEPKTILTALGFGPELLYRTNHRVLAGPYHRNSAGILDIHETFTTTDARARARLLAEREIEWILICPERDRGTFGTPGGLYMSLLEDPGPEIRPVPLPEELAKEFKLFAVHPSHLTSGL